jgi:hypothetical protein
MLVRSDIPLGGQMYRIALHAETVDRFHPHPDVRFVPRDGPPVEIAVATRTTGDRHAIAAVRHATRLLGGVGGSMSRPAKSAAPFRRRIPARARGSRHHDQRGRLCDADPARAGVLDLDGAPGVLQGGT